MNAQFEPIVSLPYTDDAERLKLHKRFEDRLSVNNNLSRKLVSYQGNRDIPGFRWIKYKEGFSSKLVESFIEEHNPQNLLDPFAGIGTAPLSAAWRGSQATGIEIMPVGVLAGRSIAYVSNGVSDVELRDTCNQLLLHISSNHKPPDHYLFPHVKITEFAFSTTTEKELAKARHFLDSIDNLNLRQLLNFACMTSLEESSFTRKDGQYLRWDYRCGRMLRSKCDIGAITPFPIVLKRRLAQIQEDVVRLKYEKNEFTPTFIAGSCLEQLTHQSDDKFDMVFTSPPYANRYDYTRTYALELAWLGYNQGAFSQLRQSMLTATVENKCKNEWLEVVYRSKPSTFDKARSMYREQRALHEVLMLLNRNVAELGNKNVIRLLEGYFFEMALVVAELGRVLKKDGVVIMVNDNVQYHGEEVPVDFILADFAELCGFKCENIWALPRGKGNSSQQMAKFGRREIRKCVYKWVKVSD